MTENHRKDSCDVTENVSPRIEREYSTRTLHNSNNKNRWETWVIKGWRWRVVGRVRCQISIKCHLKSIFNWGLQSRFRLLKRLGVTWPSFSLSAQNCVCGKVELKTLNLITDWELGSRSTLKASFNNRNFPAPIPLSSASSFLLLSDETMP